MEIVTTDCNEVLAQYSHESWCGWMRYLFSLSTLNEDGTMTIPRESVERWSRQTETEYANLPEAEKKSDRNESRKIMSLISGTT